MPDDLLVTRWVRSSPESGLREADADSDMQRIRPDNGKSPGGDRLPQTLSSDAGGLEARLGHEDGQFLAANPSAAPIGDRTPRSMRIGSPLPSIGAAGIRASYRKASRSPAKDAERSWCTQ